ncbi:MAG: diacylglycerol/lipid kinase family protein [Actinomycetota bacterium]
MNAGERPPAVLVVNPNAGRISERTRGEVIDALRGRLKIDAFATTARDTGISIASAAVEEGADLVIAFGGDGHVNEVANGVAGTNATLGIIPGGTMNVFARALGVPLDPLEAIEHLLSIRPGRERRVPLGTIDGRYFTFSAGCGFDAEAAERVERYVPAKRRFGEMFFYWSAFRVLAGSYRHRNPSMILKGSFGEIPVAMAIACNAGPYAYLAGRPVSIAPNVTLEGGLDVFALRRMRIEALGSYTARSLIGGLISHPDAFYATDMDAFELRSEKPFYRHVDGEPLAPASSARFSIARDVLKVRA